MSKAMAVNEQGGDSPREEQVKRPSRLVQIIAKIIVLPQVWRLWSIDPARISPLSLPAHLCARLPLATQPTSESPTAYQGCTCVPRQLEQSRGVRDRNCRNLLDGSVGRQVFFRRCHSLPSTVTLIKITESHRDSWRNVLVTGSGQVDSVKLVPHLLTVQLLAHSSLPALTYSDLQSTKRAIALQPYGYIPSRTRLHS